MCLPEKWREPEISALPECTRIFLSTMFVGDFCDHFCALTGALGTCTITLIHNYTIIKADAAALECPQ